MNHISVYCSNETSNTIFLQPNDKEEKANKCSLNLNKASSSNSILLKLLLLNNKILKQLADLLNFSIMTGVFSSVLKIAKVVPFFKKD